MPRKIVYIHHFFIILFIVFSINQYAEFIKTYREQHPTYEVNQLKYESEAMGVVTSIAVSKNTCVINSLNGNKIEITDLDESMINNILNGDIWVDVVYENDYTLWTAPKNKGMFDYDRYLYSKGITLKGRAITISVFNPELTLFDQVRTSLIKARFSLLNKVLLLNDGSPKISEMLSALFFKETGLLQDYESYKSLGIAHLFTISGLHFGLLYLCFKKIFCLGPKNLRTYCLIAAMCFIFFFLDSGIASLRALLMVLYIEFANLLMRKPDRLVMIVVVNLFILIIYQGAILSTSYLLSFYAYTAIAYVMPMIKLNFKFKVINSILVYFILQLILLPITLVLFKTYNLWSFLANLIFIPIFSIFVPLCFLLLVMISFTPALAMFILPAYTFLINVINHVMMVLPEYLIDLPIIHSFDLWLVFILFMTLTLMLSTVKFRLRAYRYTLILTTILLVSTLGIHIRNSYNEDLIITFFDVKHGDCALISYKNHNILIDTGSQYADMNEILKSNGIRVLDYVILSHAHEDHIGGFYKINESIKVNQVICLSDTKNVLESNGANLPPVVTMKKLNIDALNLEFGTHFDHDEPNDQGIWVKLKYYDFTATFLGDYSLSTLELIDLPSKITLLKVPHHGSYTSMDTTFFRRHKVESALISHHQRYALPDEEVYSLLKSEAETLFTTYNNGNVIYTVTPEGYTTTDYFDQLLMNFKYRK